MSYRLVIAEKPSVAQAYAKVLGATNRNDGYLEGNGYLVSWCIGHLVVHRHMRYDKLQGPTSIELISCTTNRPSRNVSRDSK